MGFFRDFCLFLNYFLKICDFTQNFKMTRSRCFFDAFWPIISANEPLRSGKQDSELILTFWRKNQQEILKKVCTLCKWSPCIVSHMHVGIEVRSLGPPCGKILTFFTLLFVDLEFFWSFNEIKIRFGIYSLRR